MGAYVSLLEYNEIEGMILLSELSRRRIRSVNKLIRVGRNEIVEVLRVDKEKGYIDLSKRRVAPDDVRKADERFQKSKAVHSIMRHVSETEHLDLEEFYSRAGWPLYRKFGHAYDAFRVAITDPDIVFQDVKLSDTERDVLLRSIRRRMTPQPIKIRADIEVTCFHYRGIEAIREALKAGLAAVPDEQQVSIRLLAPPLFVVTTMSLNKGDGITLLQTVIDAIKVHIEKEKGGLAVKAAPRAVSETDDRTLAKLMEDLERANMEVDGDDDNSEDEADEAGGAGDEEEEEEEEV